MAWVFSTLHPGLTVEVGTGSGESFSALCELASYFAPHGRLVGVDAWDEEPALVALEDMCRTRYAEFAELRRCDTLRAADAFGEATIDLLHVTSEDLGVAGKSLWDDWLPKLRPGGVVVVTLLDRSDPSGSESLWAQLSRAHFGMRTAEIDGLGAAQPGDGGGLPVIELLQQTPEASTLFRLLGERLGYRHLKGGQPISEAGLKACIASLEAEIARLSDDLADRTRAAEDLRFRVDTLLAKIATRAASHEQQVKRLTHDIEQLQKHISEQSVANEAHHRQIVEQMAAFHANELSEMEGRHASELAEVQQRLAGYEKHLQDVLNTKSWRLTAPLRVLQRARMRLTA